jgi:enolase-phosphatase E1
MTLQGPGIRLLLYHQWRCQFPHLFQRCRTLSVFFLPFLSYLQRYQPPRNHLTTALTGLPTQFPYALQALPDVLDSQWNSPSFRPYRDAFPEEYRASPSTLLAHVQELMSRDVKISYLKSLQGYLWLNGYESGALRCPLFPDVHPALQKWYKAGIPIVIYSSGSVPAQKLLFQYTNSEPDADLRGVLSGYFDTANAGRKVEKGSYENIAGTRGESVGKWLFLSDNVKEVEAAREAGMQSFVVVRDGNAPLSGQDKVEQTLVKSFEEIQIKKN